MYTLCIFTRGRLGVVDMTVGDGCILKLGATGDTISTTGGKGIYNFNKLTVKAGGEVTVTDDLTNMSSNLTITVSNNVTYRNRRIHFFRCSYCHGHKFHNNNTCKS